MTPASPSAVRDLVIVRVIDAPRSLVFKAWTDAECLARWWGPSGFTTPFCRVDARPGGAFHYCMRARHGRDYWGKGAFREVAPPERLVFTDAFVDEAGNPVSPESCGVDPEWPAETVVTVTLAECGGATVLTLHQTVPESVARRAGTLQGWREMLERLSENVAAA